MVLVPPASVMVKKLTRGLDTGGGTRGRLGKKVAIGRLGKKG